MTRPLTEAQRKYAGHGTQTMRKTGLSRAQQIRACQRSYIYDGSLAPVCIACGGPRENRRGLKCDACEARS